MLFIMNHIPYLQDLSNSFSNSFIDFTAAKLFHQVLSFFFLQYNKLINSYKSYYHVNNYIPLSQVEFFIKCFASIMAVVLNLPIYFTSVHTKCLHFKHFVMSYMRQNKK